MVGIYAVIVMAAFVVGAVPFSWLIAKIAAGVDLRTVGSGNPGATNLYRTVGPAWGIAGLMMDGVKGWLPVYGASVLFPDVTAATIIAGACAIAGHMWTPFLKFHGGKGVATAAGVFLALSPLTLAIAVGVFVVVVAITRYVSLGSLAAALAAVLYSLLVPPLSNQKPDPFFVSFCAVCFMAIAIAHRQNIRRLLSGKENKFKFSKL